MLSECACVLSVYVCMVYVSVCYLLNAWLTTQPKRQDKTKENKFDLTWLCFAFAFAFAPTRQLLLLLLLGKLN